MLIAIPSEAPGGLDAAVSEHFGHCPAFTIVTIENGEIGAVQVLENAAHEQGGCMAPVMLLKQNNVDALVAGGMGATPLSGLQQVGIDVYFKEEASTVRDAAELFAGGKCRQYAPAQTCEGGGGHCGGHGHEQVEREPIEGKADIRKDRVVSIEFQLKDAAGTLIDSSSRNGPMRYLHGHGNIPAGLEKGVEGLEAGAQRVIEVPCAEGFGERSDDNVFEVPRAQLPPEVQVGNRLSAHDEAGRIVQLTVVEIGEETARLDANHPLAGMDLVFEVTVLGVEKATEQELEHGHIH